MGPTQLNISSLPGPETIARRVFSNGMVGLAYENWSSPSIVVYCWLWAGSIDVPRDKAGLSSLAASMLTRGTERRTFAQIGEEIESIGAALTVASGGHTTNLTAKCLAEDLPLLLDILTDCLYHPSFPEEYLEKRRGEILTLIEQREHNTRALASLNFYELLYPDHPYGHSQLGYKDTISGLTRHDVQAFYREHLGARGMGAAIVGAIPRQKGLDMLEETMGQWVGASHNPAELPPTPVVKERQQTRALMPGKTQSDIILGWIGLQRQDPDFFAAYLANCILGQFGMMGRIGDYVRDQMGLAYYAYTSLDAGLGPGPWSAIAGVAPDQVDLAVEAILEQIRRIRQEPVDEAELADNRAYIIGSMPLRLESKEMAAAQIANIEIYQRELDYLQHFPLLVEAVTADHILRVTRQYLDPDAYVLSIAGPPEKEEA
jgi:zinc protease